MIDYFSRIHDVIVWIKDFFVLMRNDDEYWLCLMDFFIVIIGLRKIFVVSLWHLYYLVSASFSGLNARMSRATISIK